MSQNVLDMTREQLIERAREMIPALRQRAEETERIKRIPEATVNELKQAGIMKILRAKMYGGMEFDFRTYTAVVTEIARGCGSTGWFVSLSNIRDYMIAYVFGQKALDEIFSSGHDIIFAGNFKPVKCNIKRVEGGIYIEEAQWPFVSGCLHADWGYFGFPFADENGNPEFAIMVVPYKDAEILDDWNVMGLRGSGSNSVRIKDMFVPEHRVSLDRLAQQGYYTSEKLRDISIYRTAFVPALTLSIVCSSVGIVKGAMDVHMEHVMKSGIGNTFYMKQSEAPVTHQQIGQAQLKIDSAEMHLLRAAEKLDEYARQNRKMTQEERIRIKAEFGYVNQLCKEAIELLVAGASSIFVYNHNPLQRYYRDFMALHLHAFITPSSLIETYGRVLCGLEPNTYFA